MFKKITDTLKDTIKQTAENVVDSQLNKAEDFLSELTAMPQIQSHVTNVISRMTGRSNLYVWSKGYWQQFDLENKIEPLLDRKAYMKKGKKFKQGKVYKVGSMFQSEISIGASIGDLGTVYNLDYLKTPAQYAVAKDEDTVMLFNWLG